jgi:predicted Fe-Mo cluster-binding NifX family protein
MTIKIAAATEDQHNISNHFGRAPHYRIITVEDSKIIGSELRSKPFHGPQEPHPAGGNHSHDDMFAPVADCQVLLCGGMGTPALEKAQAVGLTVILTGGDIEAAVQAYLSGALASDLRRIHRH